MVPIAIGYSGGHLENISEMRYIYVLYLHINYLIGILSHQNDCLAELSMKYLALSNVVGAGIKLDLES